jgi:DNA-binding winged helix-turn-helix (wHTH) protein
MAEANWQISWQDEGVEHYAMVLDCPNRCIQILESVIPITKDYLVLTARILTRANGSIVSESEFNDQYYKTNTSSNQDTGTNLRKYCSQLNAVLQAVLGDLAPKDRVFKSIRSRGYQLNPKYLPVKIIE